MKPLSIYHVTGQKVRDADQRVVSLGDHWYWCRSHHRPEHCDWTMLGCTRIGPFMTQAEAEVCTELPR